MSFRAIAAALAAGHAAVAIAAPIHEYKADDGSGSINHGLAFTGQVMWGNYFEVEENCNLITSVSVAFGNIPAGRSVQVLVFDDPDDDQNPSNATLVGSGSGLTAEPKTNTYIQFPITTPATVSGGFFVAAIMDVTIGEAPPRSDPQSNSGRSWLIANPGTIDLQNMAASAMYLNLQAVGPMTTMVRAHAVPAPGAAILLALGACIGIGRRRPS